MCRNKFLYWSKKQPVCSHTASSRLRHESGGETTALLSSGGDILYTGEPAFLGEVDGSRFKHEDLELVSADSLSASDNLFDRTVFLVLSLCAAWG